MHQRGEHERGLGEARDPHDGLVGARIGDAREAVGHAEAARDVVRRPQEEPGKRQRGVRGDRARGDGLRGTVAQAARREREQQHHQQDVVPALEREADEVDQAMSAP